MSETVDFYSLLRQKLDWQAQGHTYGQWKVNCENYSILSQLKDSAGHYFVYFNPEPMLLGFPVKVDNRAEQVKLIWARIPVEKGDRCIYCNRKNAGYETCQGCGAPA